MGTHRKPKTKPTAFTAVVTAAIVMPAGTAAAAAYGALGESKTNTRDVSAGLLAAKANAAAKSAANSTIRRAATVLTPIPATTTPTPAITPTTPTPTTATLTPALTPTATAAATTTPSPSARPTPSAPSKPSASTTPAAPSAKATTPKPPSTAPAPPKSTTTPPSASASASPPSATTAGPNPYRNVSLASLEPTGLYGAQQYATLTSKQWANAKTIVRVTKQRGMPPYAAVIAVATAMQESSLINLTYAINHDSLGLFQQRPSMGWGTHAQITDPVYATNTFLTALTAYAPNYDSQALWVSAQAVQRSGLPTAYAQWQDQAARIVRAITNGTVCCQSR